MWTKPLQMGGIVGDDNFPIRGNTWFEGSAYSQRYQNPIIIHGRLYYNPPVGFTGTGSGPQTCVDLRTGEVIWERTDLPQFDFGLVYDVEDPQQHGVYPAMLIDVSGSTWRIYDAWTGTSIANATGIPSGTKALGPQGEYLIYAIYNAGNSSVQNYHMRLWNSSLLWTGTGWANPTSSGLSPAWDTTTTTTTTNVTTTTYVNGALVTTLTPTTTSTTFVNASIDSGTHTRYSWDVPISWRNNMSPSPAVVFVSAYNDVMVLRQGTQPGLTPAGFGTTSQTPYSYIGVNLNASSPGYSLGEKMWTTDLQPPENNITVCTGIVDKVSRTFTESYKETTQHVGFDLDNGKKLWTSNGQAPLDYYGNPSVPWIASAAYQGKLYSSAYGGILYCYDLRNGTLLWTYGNGGPGNSTNSGLYLAYGHYPTQIGAFGSGIAYVFTSEHTVNTPIYKGALWRAVNATTGEEVWTLSGYTGTFFVFSNAMADGFLTFFNGYDNQIYSVGRGPSATTVSAPDIAAAFGTPVVIKGTVTDISAGTMQDEQAARFPNGVPAMSDASMKDWMGYVYQQRPRPMDAVGVEVTISVLDANGNYRDIGTVTSDADGFFSLEWMPEIPGKYTVYASFTGTKGYWPSHDVTAFTVLEAPEATPGPTPEPGSMTDSYVAGFGIAIIIAIVVGVVVIVIVLRRK
jgi:outer membrane protein assembly factor BamB